MVWFNEENQEEELKLDTATILAGKVTNVQHERMVKTLIKIGSTRLVEIIRTLQTQELSAELLEELNAEEKRLLRMAAALALKKIGGDIAMVIMELEDDPLF